MGYFRELPNIAYQSPLSHKNSSGDYILVKNLFRRTKLADYVKSSSVAFDKFVIGEGDRPDTVAQALYGEARLDYVVILVAGITNINHEWPLQDYQVYDYALSKYGDEATMNQIRYYKTFEIKDANLPTAAFSALIKYQSFLISFFLIKGVITMGDKYKE